MQIVQRLVIHSAATGPRRRRWLAAMLCAVWLTAGAAPAPAPVPVLKVVTVGVAPWGEIDAGGQPRGIFVDYVRQLSSISGVPVTLSVVPYPRAVALIGSGAADLLITLDSAQLLRIAHQVAPVPMGDVVLISRASAPYGSLAELRGKVVGQIRGTSYLPAFDDDGRIGKRGTLSARQNLTMLLEGRFDAAIGMHTSFKYVMRQIAIKPDRLAPVLVLATVNGSLHYANKSYDAAVAARLAAAVKLLNQRRLMPSLIDAALAAAPP